MQSDKGRQRAIVLVTRELRCSANMSLELDSYIPALEPNVVPEQANVSCSAESIGDGFQLW
jgi:hypothetical protein